MSRGTIETIACSITVENLMTTERLLAGQELIEMAGLREIMNRTFFANAKGGSLMNLKSVVQLLKN